MNKCTVKQMCTKCMAEMPYWSTSTGRMPVPRDGKLWVARTVYTAVSHGQLATSVRAEEASSRFYSNLNVYITNRLKRLRCLNEET